MICTSFPYILVLIKEEPTLAEYNSANHHHRLLKALNIALPANATWLTLCVTNLNISQLNITLIMVLRQ